jgi:hypothetical protein
MTLMSVVATGTRCDAMSRIVAESDASDLLSFLEAVFLPLVKQICFCTAEVDDLGTAVSLNKFKSTRIYTRHCTKLK